MNQPENTIPFSLEKWEAGYEVVCRNGTVPSELHHFEGIRNEQPLVAVIDGLFEQFWSTGKYASGDHALDLFLRPKRETWYRRAYWGWNSLKYAIANHPKSNNLTSSDLQWAGPIEEFQVPVSGK